MKAFQNEIEICLRSRFSLLWIYSYEEERVVDELKELCKQSKRQLHSWDIASGFTTLHGTSMAVNETPTPEKALEMIENAPASEDALFILKDFHACLKYDKETVRFTRNLASSLKNTAKSIIITSPTREVHEDLRDDVFIIDFPRPDLADMQKILESFTRNPDVKLDLSKNGLSQLTRSALGLTSNQARRVFARSIVGELKDSNGKVIKPFGTLNDHCIGMISDEKKAIVKESVALEFYAAEETITSVGGLDVLKDWLKSRAETFTDQARDYGLPVPKGIALLGIPGTGKSLTAKTVAGLWKMPLVRLDVGALFGKYVGESEENTRQALALIEAVAPCVVWIDEMEKAFSYSSGTSMRVLAGFLSWMQEKKQLAFIVGTINDVSSLPAEFLRRGRFDEVFFLDLPARRDRLEIFRIHIEKRGRKAKSFDLEKLATLSEGYVGAEIEQSIIDAMYSAYNDPADPQREMTTDDISRAITGMVPLSRSQKEKVGKLREWMLDGRARPASTAEVKDSADGVAPIDLDR